MELSTDGTHHVRAREQLMTNQQTNSAAVDDDVVNITTAWTNAYASVRRLYYYSLHVYISHRKRVLARD